MEISTSNFLEAAGVVVTPSSEATNFDGDNLTSPQRPFLTWRSTAITQQTVVINLGQGRVVRLLLLVNANFTSVTIQGNSSDSWGAPPFSRALTLGRCSLTGRYQQGLFLTGFAYQYMRVLVPAQTPTDGATYFSLGGVWAGGIQTLPRPYRWQVRYSILEPRQDVTPEHEGWRQRLILGDPLVRMTLQLYSKISEGSPGDGDQLADWLAIERSIRSADFFVLHPELGDPSPNIFVTRKLNQSEWEPESIGLQTATWELEEMIGP